MLTSDTLAFSVPEKFDAVKTDDISLKLRYILRNMDSLWFGKPRQVLKALSEIDGVTVNQIGSRNFDVSAGVFSCLIRIDDIRPGLNGARQIPKAYITQSWLVNDRGESQQLSPSCV